MSSDSSDVEINEQMMPPPDFLRAENNEVHSLLDLNYLATQDELEQKLIDKDHESKLLAYKNQMLYDNLAALYQELQILRDYLVYEKYRPAVSNQGLEKQFYQTYQNLSFYQLENTYLKTKIEYLQNDQAKNNAYMTLIYNQLNEGRQQLYLQQKKHDYAVQKLEYQKQQYSLMIGNLYNQLKTVEAAASRTYQECDAKIYSVDELSYKIYELNSDNSVKDIHIYKLVYQLEQCKADNHKLQLKADVASSGTDELLKINQNKLAVLRYQLEDVESELIEQQKHWKYSAREKDSKIEELELYAGKHQAAMLLTEQKYHAYNDEIMYLKTYLKELDGIKYSNEEKIARIAELEELVKYLYQTYEPKYAQTCDNSQPRYDYQGSNLSCNFLKAELAVAKNENFDLKSQLYKIENDNYLLQTLHCERQYQLPNMQIERLQAQLLDFTQIRELNAEQSKYILELKRYISEYQLKITELAHYLDIARQTAKHAEEVVCSKDKQIQQLNSNLDELFAYNEEAMQDQTQQFYNILDENTSLKNQLQTTVRQQQRLSYEYEALERKMYLYEQQMLAKQAEFANVEDSKRRAEEAERYVVYLRTEAEQQQLALRYAEQRAEDAQASLILAAYKVEAAEEVYRELARTHFELTNVMKVADEYHQSVETLQEYIRVYHEQYEALQYLANEAEIDLQEQQRQCAEFKSQLENVATGNSTEMTRVHTELQAALQQVETLKQESHRLENQLQQERYNVACQVHQYNQFKQQMQTHIKAVTYNAYIMQRENEKLRQIYSSLQEK